MKRRLLLCPLVIAMLFAGAGTARADMAELIDYILGLSGPGEFWGVRFSEDLYCWSVERNAPATAKPERGWLFNCYGTDKGRPLTTISGAFEKAHTDKNPYFYPPDVVATKDSGVDAWLTMVTVDTNVWGPNRIVRRAFSVGASAGFVVFSGSRFGAFTNPYLELPRITFTPFALIPDHGSYTAKKDILRFRFVMRSMGGVRYTDFGAAGPSSGSSTEHEFRPGVMVEANFALPRPR
jgi:hypothetical protein